MAAKEELSGETIEDVGFDGGADGQGVMKAEVTGTFSTTSSSQQSPNSNYGCWWLYRNRPVCQYRRWSC
jgi:hypothetical protein